MKKPKFPIWIIIAIISLVGGLVLLTTMNNKNVQTFSDHDHDHDGKPDHGENAHR